MRQDVFQPALAKQRPIRMVCLGGGTGLPLVLGGLARQARRKALHWGLDITAIVAMSDDGGSSGRLRRSRGILPPGDVRNCLVALAERKNGLSEIFQYRFSGKKGLAGHAIGNLLITALAELKGDFLEAVASAATLLQARGRVLPCTLASVELVASKANQTCVIGERNLRRTPGRVMWVNLRPKLPPASEGTIEAIERADLISIGPGSLYSSLLPNLLVDGVADALRRTRALKVMILNLMTQPGETDGMDAAEHVRAVVEHAGPVLDVVLINARPLPWDAIRRYAQRSSVPVVGRLSDLSGLGVRSVEADLLKEGRAIRHDGRKLARCLLRLARRGV
jgi:uncharacterized cofD-like protein